MRTLFIYTLVLLLLSMAGIAYAQNLIVNGDFEGGSYPAANGNIGNGWTAWSQCWPSGPGIPPCGAPAYWFQADGPFPGVHFQRVISGSWMGHGADGGMFQVVDVIPGKTYDFDVDASFGNIGGGDPGNRQCYYGYDLTGQTIDPFAPTVTWIQIPELQGTPWSHFHSRFTATGSTVSVWGRFRIYYPDTVAYGDFDNFSLTEAVLPDLNITSGPTVTDVGESGATISWTTDNPATSVVEYGLATPYSDSVSYPVLKTEHSITLTGLLPGKVYHFRVKSENTGVYNSVVSLDNTFQTVPTPGVFFNGDFEAVDGTGQPTLSPWFTFGMCDGLFGPDTPNTNMFGASAHSPTHIAGSAASYGTEKNLGGLFQRVLTTPDTWYKARAYIWTWQYTQDALQRASSNVNCRIGIDPTGGIDPNAPTVEWSSWQYSQPWNDPTAWPEWIQIGTVAKAQGTSATIFLQVNHKWAIEWNLTYFDDVTFGTEATEGQVDYANHIGKAKVILGEGYPVRFTDKVVTAQWTQLEGENYHSYCYIQEDDRTAGIKVDYTNVSSAPPVAVGARIEIHGQLVTLGHEPVLVADSLTITTPDTVPPVLPKPVGVIGKNISSGSLGMQSALPGFAGLSNTGVRVRLAGRVTGAIDDYSSGTGMFALYVDDGSGALNDSAILLGGAGVPGVKVLCQNPVMPFLEGLVGVTGTAGLQYDSNIGAFPVIRVYDEYADIDPFPE